MAAGASGGTGASSRYRWQPASSTLRLRAMAYLFASDIMGIVLGFALVVLLRGRLTMDGSWIVMLAVILPVYAGVAVSSHGYSSKPLQDPYRAMLLGVQSLILAVSAVIFVAYFLRAGTNFPRLTIGFGTIASLVAIMTSRYLIVRHLHWLIGGNPFKVILIHDGEAPVPNGTFSVLMVADHYFDPSRHDPVMYDRLATSLAGAERVVVSCIPERRAAWAQALKGASVMSEIALPELEALAPLGKKQGSIPTVVVSKGPLGLADRILKRAFDTAVALTAIVVFAPVLIVVAIAVKLDSPGPILFRQTRIGRSNRMFEMLKFRSMRAVQSDHDGSRSTARDDDRITRVGRFIRSSSIDELPQLFNVLGGSMSIVGPRPHALGSRAADKLFWEVDGRYWHRHAAKPGLTGLAQVRGYRGATVFEDDLRHRLQADLEYLDTWSIWRDLKIILRTFGVIFHRNAF